MSFSKPEKAARKAGAEVAAKSARVPTGQKGAPLSLSERRRREERKRGEAFLEGLRGGLSVAHAAGKAGFTRQAAYLRRKNDLEFAQAWNDAIEQGTDVLEDAATVRAVRGVEKPVFQQGKQVGTIREYSDILMIFLLKARRPEKYRDNATIEHTGAGGGPIKLEVGEARARLADRLGRLGAAVPRLAPKPGVIPPGAS